MPRFHLPVRPRVILRSAFIVLFLVLALYVLFFSELRPRSIAHIKEELGAFGVWAPVAMIALHTVSVVLLIPGFLMVLATALIFGLDSIWISMAGQTLGSLAAYGLARAFGRDVLHAILGNRVIAIERILEARGFHYLLYLRLMGFLPLPLLVYGPGLVRVPFLHFLFATLLGQAPFIIVVGFFGDSIARITGPEDLTRPIVLVPVVFLIALLTFPIAISLAVRRARRRRIPGEPDPPPEETDVHEADGPPPAGGDDEPPPEP
jgi:uncharacterized membrane protein YdjX (TVP38/TMEM64 family)